MASALRGQMNDGVGKFFATVTFSCAKRRQV